MQGLGDTFSFAPVPTPRLQKADGPSTGATLPAYSVVQRPYGRCSPTVPFTALSSFLTPFGVGGESSFSNFTKASNSTPLRGVGLYPRFEKLLFSPSFFYKSLYVHVPFCRKKCPYCDFYSTTREELKSLYQKAINRELSLYGFNSVPFPTVYFGGGTPSMMPPEFFESILSRIGQFSEVTVEFNPEDAGKAGELRQIGINRASLGLQSLSEKALNFLRRNHTAADGLRSLETLLNHFSNVSVDLMYGIPGQSVEDFLKDIETVTSFPIKHISIYALTIYEGTPFHRKLLKGEIWLPEEEKLEKFYYEAVSLLESKGFFQYEISNFAKKGFECKHNLSYWRVENYLGVGPSAASLIAGKYWKNVADLKKYIEIVQRGERPTAEEVKLSGKDLLEVKLLMGLRLTEGIKLGKKLEKLLKKDKILSLLEEGFLEIEEGRLRLGKKGLFVSNTVIAEVISAIE